MWIICENGEAINMDHVANLRWVGSSLYATLVGCKGSAIVSTRDASIEAIVREAISGTKLLDFRGCDNG